VEARAVTRLHRGPERGHLRLTPGRDPQRHGVIHGGLTWPPVVSAERLRSDSTPGDGTDCRCCAAIRPPRQMRMRSVVLTAARADIYSHGMARVASLVLAACAVLITACTAAQAPLPAGTGTPAQPDGGTAPAGGPARPPPVPGAAYASGGCGATPLLLGSAPRWASSANPPPIRYALAGRGQVAGFVFGYPLMAGNPQPYSDKILWVVAWPRDGMPLRLTGHRLHAARPVVSSTWPADSSPGEIYPSDIEVPAPGCWQFTLSWNGHTDTVDLWYVRHRQQS
jgi:hypothetical protein